MNGVLAIEPVQSWSPRRPLVWSGGGYLPVGAPST
jgi:hypothetical protein